MFAVLPGYELIVKLLKSGEAKWHGLSVSFNNRSNFRAVFSRGFMGRFHQSFVKNLALHRLVPLRQRYIMTKRNTVRLRYVAGLAVIFGGIGLLAAVQTSGAFSSTGYSQIAMGPFLPGEVSAPPMDFGKRVEKLAGDIEGMIPMPTGPQKHIIKVSSGETMAGVLEKSGVDDESAYAVVKAMSEHFDPRKVKAGQEVSLKFDPVGDDMQLSEMSMKLDTTHEVVVSRNDDSDFVGRVHEKEVKERTIAKMARIENSVYGSAARAGIPAPVVAEVIKLYSQNVDFQRDIQRDDKIEVLYSAYETKDGDVARLGDVQYASLTISGKVIPIYRYAQDGNVDYYDEKGHSIRSTLMRTPVDGARISSGFGMREHPILGYTKMHKGVDFAAPIGTPIYAAGNGTVEYAGRFSTYGNYVRIRHNGSLKTAYAHMRGFANGIHPGDHVRQGEVIGYIGVTGRSTGPHLHYEVLVNNQQVNPKSVGLPTGDQLHGKDLDKFKSMVRNMQKQYVAMVEGTNFAQNDSENSVR